MPAVSNVLKESNSANLGRMEIRRLKMMAGGVANYIDIAKKRSRCSPHGGNEDDDAVQDNESEGLVGGGGGAGGDSNCKFKLGGQSSQDDRDIDSQAILVRSVSTPSVAMQSLFSAYCAEKRVGSSFLKVNPIKESAYEGQEIDPEGGGGTTAADQLEMDKSAFCDPAEAASVIKPKISRTTTTMMATTLSRAKSENISNLFRDSCPPHGLSSIIGRRSEMEDTVAAVPSFYLDPPCRSFNKNPLNESLCALHFFGVYDGHGGSQASAFCKQRFHEVLAEELRALPAAACQENSRRGNSEWETVFKNCFKRIDIEVGGMCPSGNCSDEMDDAADNGSSCSRCCQDLVAPENVGSTAVVAVLTPSQIIVANCGDSRAVLSRGGKAIPFSNDHKPQRADEMLRIEAAGGRVIYWNGYRVGGFLAMSRAIGDRFLKQFVISEPEVTCAERTDEDECLILATDGLWDILSNDFVCEVARKCLAGYLPRRSKGIAEGCSAVTVAAALLTKLAHGRGSNDNISVIVVDLSPNSSFNRTLGSPRQRQKQKQKPKQKQQK